MATCLSACGQDAAPMDVQPSAAAPAKCVPGSVTTCACERGASGGMTCASSGLGFGPCSCPASPAPQAGVSATGSVAQAGSTALPPSTVVTGPPPSASSAGTMAAPAGAAAPASNDESCYPLRAHGLAADTPFPVVAGTTDLYQCFMFTPPWKQTTQAVSFRSRIDNSKILHHWLLYQNRAPVKAGGMKCSGAHPEAALVAGWAVGGSDTVLPADVGIEMDMNGVTLEVHYNNPSTADVTDNSGVDVCVSKQARPHTAVVHWLGTSSLNLTGPGTITATCSPTYATGPITIVSSWPHMHKHGSRMVSTIIRADGRRETLLDKPFDFSYQVAFPTPAVLTTGDRVETACTYGSGPVRFGEGTSDEMCFDFVIAWPAGALVSTGGLTYSPNQCFR
jgi:hypothetical protein